MSSLSPIAWTEITLRLLIAIALGAVIGFEREYRQKEAGLRTNMLVTLGAAIFVLVPIQSGLAEADTTALARSIQGIITGVGFVGAGSIFREDEIRGLTSATAIWISAGAGIAAGLGEWPLGLIGTGLALVILRLMKLLEKKL